MPYKANEARRHEIPKARYEVANWPEYGGALQQRGNPPKACRRGRPPQDAEIAIETRHLLRPGFGQPWLQAEGLLRPLAVLRGLSIGNRARTLPAQNAAAAEACFDEAVTQARWHGALSWELRIAISWVELQAPAARSEAARQILSPVYKDSKGISRLLTWSQHAP
jgi:hypothetical protein